MPSHARLARAYTLIELMVAMAVGMLLMTAVLVTLVSTARLMGWVGARSDLGSAALLSLNNLSRELRTSAFDSMTIVSGPNPTPTALAFQVEDPTASNPATFVPTHSYILYYADGQGNFVRKTWTDTQPPTLTPDPLTTATRLTGPQVTSIVGTPDGTEHTVATGVLSVTFTPSAFPTTTPINGIQVGLSLQKPVNSSQNVDQNVSTTIYPRNHP